MSDFFLSENFQLLVVNFSICLNRCVFVMNLVCLTLIFIVKPLMPKGLFYIFLCIGPCIMAGVPVFSYCHYLL